jgi:mRNA interferase HicA
VKRRDLERHLRAHGALPQKEGGNHTKWVSPGGRSAVPRHTEIKAGLAIAICKQLDVPPPPNPR